MTIRVLVTGDNHLDNPSAQYGTMKRERRKDFRKSFKSVIDYALENGVDLFLVCGDLFHNCRPSNTTRAWVMEQFRELAKKGVRIYAVTGHHDTPKSILSGVSPLKTHGESGHITYLENPSSPEAHDLTIHGKKVRIVGIGFNPALRPDDDPLDVDIPAPDGDLNILMLHYPVTGFSGFMGDEAKVRSDRLPKGYQLVVAGHFHTAQEKRIGSSLIVVPGSTERVSFHEEEGTKSFSVITVRDDLEMSVEKIPLDCREMITAEIGIEDGDDINKLVMDKVEELANQEVILRIRVEGSITPETLATYRKPPLQRKGNELCFKLLLDDTDSLRVRGMRDVEPIASIDPDDELLSYFDARREGLDRNEGAMVERAKARCIELLEEVASE